MERQLEFTLFGSPQVRLHGLPVSGFRSGKAQALLYYLVTTGRHHARSMLALLLWGDQSEEAARVSLSKCLSNLNDLLGDALLIQRQSVAINPNYPYTLDCETLAAAIALPPTPERIPTLQSALALYQGDFLEGFYVRDAPDFEQWQLLQRARYREAVVHGLHQLATFMQQQGDLSGAITQMRHLLTIEVWREEAHRQLMSLLARTGQRAAALAQYESCRQILAKELSVEPDEQTSALAEAIRSGDFDPAAPLQEVKGQQGRAQRDPTQAAKGQETKQQKVIRQEELLPSSESALASRVQLPQPLTGFVGRREEIAHLARQMRDPSCRLMTLVGPGGMGKTRLAIEVARVLQADPTNFPDGIHFISLAGHDSPLQLDHAIAEAVSLVIDPQQELLRQLQLFLADKRLLLLLDNFEERLDSADRVAHLLLAAPDLRVLVTSRQRLQLPGEYLFVVRGLDFDGTYPLHESGPAPAQEQASAVQLFLQSARQNLMEVKFSVEEMAAVSAICSQVEGMPLGIELAASWVGVLTPAEISQEVQQSLDILTREQRSGKQEHNDMRALFEGTWQKLESSEQRLFARLACFRAPFTREAAEQVGVVSPRILSALANKSLIQQERGSRRFRIHALLRQFAEEKLRAFDEQSATQPGTASADKSTGELAQSYARMSAYYGKFLRKQQARLRGQEYRAAMEEIDLELENIRAAWQWAVANRQLEVVEESLWSLQFYYECRYRFEEIYLLLDQAVEAFEMKKPVGRRGFLLARLLIAKGHTLARVRFHRDVKVDFERPKELQRRSLHILETLGGADSREEAQALALWNLAWALRLSGEGKEAIHFARQAVAIDERHHFLWDLRWSLFELARSYAREHLSSEANPVYRRCIALCEVDGDLSTCGWVLHEFADSLRAIRDFDEGREVAKKALAINNALGRKLDAANSVYVLAWIELHSHNYAAAQTVAQEALHRFHAIGHFRLEDRTRLVLGHAATAQGDFALARSYFHAILERLFKANALTNDWYGVEAAKGLAELLVEEGRHAVAAELLEYVVRQPATEEELRVKASKLLANLHADGKIPTPPPQGSTQGSASRSIYLVVAELLGEQGS